MECVIFIGTQACGKTSLFKERFFRTHVRINLDMLKTRHRERRLLRTCIETRQPFVIDNTNSLAAERAQYVTPAKQAGFRVVGYYFQSQLAVALSRNAARPPADRVPEKGIRGIHARLQRPSLAEGFDALHYVSLVDGGGFSVQEWADEVR